MIAAVDTNVLLDVLIPNPRFVGQSKELLDYARARGGLLISPVVYAELRAFFESDALAEEFVTETTIEIRPMAAPEALMAGEAWKRRARRHKSERS